MKLYYDKRLSDPTYYAQQGIRNGAKTTTRNIKKFGKHSELLMITDDPLKYVTEEIRKMNEAYRSGRETYSLTVDFNERIPKSDAEASATAVLNIGYLFIQYIVKELDLKKFFESKTREMKITYDCYTVCRFLIYARILDPRSKYGTWDRLSTYFEQPKFGYQHILRFMDILEENYSEYLSWLYKKSGKVIQRDTSILYYDCTNFYFECEQEDESFIDEVTGEKIEGLRRYGVSKEHRPNPIVEMGLFMDRDGIPISMCLHPGNKSEQLTAIPLEKEVQGMLEGAEFIYCADAGLGSYNIRKFNSMGGRRFVVTESLKKLSEQMQQAVFNDYDYKLLSTDSPVTLESMRSFDKTDPNNLTLYEDRAYKVIPADREVDLGFTETTKSTSGKTRQTKAKGLIKQTIIVTFSRKMMEYQRAVRNRQIERAKSLLSKQDPEEIKKGPNDVRRFMKRVAKTKSGEKAEVSYALDTDKIDQEEKYDGFYALATNVDMPVRDILEISHGRYRIEECFRITKTSFSGRPVNHREPRRIRAHFLICFTALLVYRLLETQLKRKNTPVTTANLMETLRNMGVINIHDVEYMATYMNSKALEALVQLTALQFDRTHFRPKDLRKLIKSLL